MIDKLEKIPLFQNHKATLTQLSYDKSKKKYMTESKEIAVDLDQVAEEYHKIRNLSCIPHSNDALYWDETGKISMIEFKNGKINSNERKNLHLKIYDSALMLTDLADISLEEMKTTVDYVLVYNDQIPSNIAKNVPNSVYLDEFEKSLTELAKEERILFGLEKFLLFCHKSVHTYTVEEFEQYLERL